MLRESTVDEAGEYYYYEGGVLQRTLIKEITRD